MSEEAKKVEFRNKDVVLFKDILKHDIDAYLSQVVEGMALEEGEELLLSELDTNALASLLAQTVFKNMGTAAEATTAWFKWLRESGQIR